MAEHRVKRTLERDVLPYLVSARQLKKQWFYRMHTVFAYTTDIVVALAAIGITGPLLTLLGSTDAAADSTNKAPTFSNVLNSVSPALVYPAAVLILTWVILRVAFNREDGQKRAVLARSCTQILRQAEASLPAALGSSDPMPALTEMLEKRIRPTVDRNIQEESWPWLPFAPSIDVDVKKEANALCTRFEDAWAPIIEPELRQPPTPENKP
jgi:hypothetical protein